MAKPILFQPTRKFKTSHLDKAKNYLENTDFEIVFSELDSIQIRFSSNVRRHVCLSGQPWLYFFTEILFTDVEYLSMKVKIDSCTYHTDRLHTMNPIDHHILASLTSKSIIIPSGRVQRTVRDRRYLPRVQVHLKTVRYNKDLVLVLKLLFLNLVLLLFDVLKWNIRKCGTKIVIFALLIFLRTNLIPRRLFFSEKRSAF